MQTLELEPLAHKKLSVLIIEKEYNENEASQEDAYRVLPSDIPLESQVSTLDERIQTLSAVPLLARTNGQESAPLLTHVVIYDFNVGDKVRIVTAGNITQVDNLSIAAISGDNITFNESFYPPEDLSQYALMSQDGHLRLPLVDEESGGSSAKKVNQVKVQGFSDKEKASIVIGDQRYPCLEFLPIAKVTEREDRIFVPEGFLVYSGSHDIDMVLG